MRIRVYVDGFNFYYGAKELAQMQSPVPSWKWLDLSAMCASMVSRRWGTVTVHGLTYFTARVSPQFPGDTTGERQGVYLRALDRRGMHVVSGTFSVQAKEKRLLLNINDPNSLDPSGAKAIVQIREEKGSDVNLATAMLVDYFTLSGYAGQPQEFEGTVVVSNDSDLAGPVRRLRERGWPVGILNPRRAPSSLWDPAIPAPHFGLRIELSDLTGSPLPDPLTDAQGNVLSTATGNAIRRPKTW